MNKQIISMIVSFLDVVILILLVMNSSLPRHLTIALGCLLGSSILDLFAVRYKSYKRRVEEEKK